jgi:hypothetical protein
MTSLPPNPEPGRIPGLEPGGGVTPGDTPPAAAQTSAGTEPQPDSRRTLSPTAVISMVGLALFTLAFLVVAVLLVLKILGVTH